MKGLLTGQGSNVYVVCACAEPKEHKIRTARVTPAPHLQGNTMNNNLDKNKTPNASKQGKFDSFRAIFLFMILPCMCGLGFQNDSPIHIFVRVPGQEDRCPVTEKLLMCQIFCAFFWPLSVPEKKKQKSYGKDRNRLRRIFGLSVAA